MTIKNKNYCATVVEVKNLIPLENCDNVQGINIFGFQCVISKSVKEGDVGIFFPAETQLSKEFLKFNNLYRDKELNDNKEVKGFFEINGRIRAQKFRGHVSNGLFMPLNSISFTGAEVKVGDEFDTLNNIEICNKYEVEINTSRISNGKSVKKSRVSSENFPEHISTENYFRNEYKIADYQNMIITQKLHGTSIRIAKTWVKRELKLIERIAKFFGAKIEEKEIEYVFGSRKVTKDVNDKTQNHFYDYDLWTDEGKKFIDKCKLPDGFIIFGELIGKMKDGKEIQKNYSYGYEKPELFVYRIAMMNEDGFTQDLSWEQVKLFCKARDIKYTPEIAVINKVGFNWEIFKDKRYADTFPATVIHTKEGMVDEGICTRIETENTPIIYKAKSPLFLEHETALLDKGEVDTESEQQLIKNILN